MPGEHERGLRRQDCAQLNCPPPPMPVFHPQLLPPLDGRTGGTMRAPAVLRGPASDLSVFAGSNEAPPHGLEYSWVGGGRAPGLRRQSPYLRRQVVGPEEAYHRV